MRYEENSLKGSPLTSVNVAGNTLC